MERSEHGVPEFHNTEPRSREERLVAQSRERLEKSLLQARRRGAFHKYEEPSNPLVPEPTSPMYSDEANRFKRDAAAEMRQQKLEAWHRQQETYGRKREEQVAKEHERWERMAAEAAAEDARLEAVRAAGLRGKQNKSSEPFDIVTLRYADSPEGQKLAYKDEVTRYRSALRSQYLFQKNHAVPHNIITGEPRQLPGLLPPAPLPPAQRAQQGSGTLRGSGGGAAAGEGWGGGAIGGGPLLNSME